MGGRQRTSIFFGTEFADKSQEAAARSKGSRKSGKSKGKSKSKKK